MLAAERLCKRYGKVEALRGLDLQIGEGEVVALLGANGAGKTTVVKLLLGLVRPTSGCATIAGHSAGDSRVRSRIGYSPESPSFPAFLTVAECLHFYAELGGLDRAQRRREVERVLELTELTELQTRRTGRISKGQTQRLALAQALLGDPPILLLDEPTAGLDPVGCLAIRRLLMGWRQEGKTVLLNSHVLSEVEKVATRAVILRRGEVAWQGRLDDTSRSETSPLESLFLELNGGENHAAHDAHHAS